MREQFSCQFNKYGCAKVVILQGHHVNLFRATSLLILEIAAIEVEISDIEYYVVTDASIR